MKTLWRYTMAAAGLVTVLICIKLLIMLPPENTDRYYKGKESGSSILWSGAGNDNHDQLRDYGHQNPRLTGEMGRGVILPVEEKARGEEALKKYNVNVIASDLVSLNRQVPDSRPVGCESVQYPDDLPSTAIVIPFYNEWPSVLLRTVYSIINRTPKSLLKQIVLVDDASNLKSLKDDLDHFIKEHFPEGLIKLVRMPERVGLIRARLEGFRYVTAEVVSFFDSHMEVNVDWLQPLLVEIVKDRKTVAMGHLDYILPDTFEYSYTPGYRTRYGFDWRLIFFETYFLKSQERGKDVTDPLLGVVMVGPGFAISSDYFREIGMYDEGMKIWGGENLELAWRVWLCGGRLVHLACSKIGHIARPQPYSFPEGRYETEIYNYKRAVEVWMGPFKKFVYEHHPKMKDLDVGDLSSRIALKDRLHCRNFTWFLQNVWPELYPYGDNATHWGGVRSLKGESELCLDNNEYLFLGPEPLDIKPCVYAPESQSFSLTADKKLRTVLQCVGVREEGEDMIPVLITCQDEPVPTWTYTSSRQLKHDQTGLCLQLMAGPKLMMQSCKRGEESQMWKFPEKGPPVSLFSEHRPGAALGQVAASMKDPDGKKKSPREMLDEFEKQIMMANNMHGQPGGAMPLGGGNMMPPGGRNMMPPGGNMPPGAGNMPPGGNMMHGNMPPGGGNMIPPGAGNMMPPGAGNMRGNMPPGGGNMMPPGGGNMMPPGGGNMMPPGGGNMMPPGGGNMMLPGAGNMMPGNMPPGGGNMMPSGAGKMPSGRGNMAAGHGNMMPPGAGNMPGGGGNMPPGHGNMMPGNLPPGAGNMMGGGGGLNMMPAQGGGRIQQGLPQHGAAAMGGFGPNNLPMAQANQVMNKNHGNMGSVKTMNAMNPADFMQGQGGQLQFQPHRTKRSAGSVQQVQGKDAGMGVDGFVDRPLFEDFRNNGRL